MLGKEHRQDKNSAKTFQRREFGCGHVFNQAKVGLDTFAMFFDYKYAYDSIQQSLLSMAKARKDFFTLKVLHL